MKFIMKKFIFLFSIAIFVIGCGGTISPFLKVSYDPIDPSRQFFSAKDKRTILYIDPVVDNREFAPRKEITAFLRTTSIKNGRFKEDPKFIYQRGKYSGGKIIGGIWKTTRVPTEIVRDALETEVRRFGIKITEDRGLADGILIASIEKFNVAEISFVPYPGINSVAIIKIHLDLYQKGFDEPVWSGTLNGTPNFSSAARMYIEQGLNTALNEAVKQWHSYPGFGETLVSLSGKNSLNKPEQIIKAREGAKEFNDDIARSHLAPQNTKEDDRLISEQRLLEEGQEKNLSIHFFEQEMLSDPGNYMAHINLASAYKDDGQIEKAIFEFERAKVINPIDTLSYVGLGTLYFGLSAKYFNNGQSQKSTIELNKGIDQFKKASKLAPKDPSILYTLGTMYDLNNEGSNAIISLMKAQKLFLAKQDLKGVADCKRNLRVFFERYKFKPEDFENTKVAVAPSNKQQPVSGGTGFLFSSNDYIITNYHVVKGKHSIKAKFANGEVIEADVVSSDPKNDIAILKLKTPSSMESRELKFGDSSKVRMGEKVFTIGFPASFVLGERPKYTEGVISAVTGIKDDPTVFQITVPIQPGNSGGPLFDEKGEVIGITTASLSLRAAEVMGAIPQNINYALKSSFVKNLLTSIPESLLSSRGIVPVPKDPRNSLADFIEAVTGNVVLIEARD